MKASTPRFDHDVIEKIFTNLFSNAIKYTSENGYVGVRIYPARQDQRPESARPAAGTEYIAFTVTNTGAEIPRRQEGGHLRIVQPPLRPPSPIRKQQRAGAGHRQGTGRQPQRKHHPPFGQLESRVHGGPALHPQCRKDRQRRRIVRIHGLRDRQPADRIRRHGPQRPARPQGVQHRGHRGRPPTCGATSNSGCRSTTTYTPRQTAAKASPRQRESAPRSSSPT